MSDLETKVLSLDFGITCHAGDEKHEISRNILISIGIPGADKIREKNRRGLLNRYLAYRQRSNAKNAKEMLIAWYSKQGRRHNGKEKAERLRKDIAEYRKEKSKLKAFTPMAPLRS